MMDGTVGQLEPLEVHEDDHKTILLVDDDETQVAALEYRLGKLGFQTLKAHCGQRALRIAREEQIDLVLLDLRLPDMEGFEVCAQLADSPQTCIIPVIILSAMERPDIVRRSRAVGCEYYVRKPYDPNVLLALIENSLGQRRQLDW